MSNYHEIYLNSGIVQAKGLTQKLKNLDPVCHKNIEPISVYGELPINLNQQNNLVGLFKSEFEREIDIVLVQDKSFILAYIKSYADEYRIIVTKNNPCWTRFYVCKELSQILIYDEEINTTCTVDDVETLFSYLINTATNNENPQISADWVTYFIAIEFLLPSVIVPKLLNLKAEGFSNNLIAKRMSVPEKIVDFRLSEKGCEMFDNLS